MFVRHSIDSLDFARKGMELRGEINVADMPRLQDVLATPDGYVSFILRGTPGKNGKSVLELKLDGTCQLRCQRCLQGLLYRIDTISRLMPVAEDELDGVLPGEEGIERIPAQVQQDVVELIEEEILLGLPLAPRHELGACVVGSVNT